MKNNIANFLIFQIWSEEYKKSICLTIMILNNILYKYWGIFFILNFAARESLKICSYLRPARPTDEMSLSQLLLYRFSSLVPHPPTTLTLQIYFRSSFSSKACVDVTMLVVARVCCRFGQKIFFFTPNLWLGVSAFRFDYRNFDQCARLKRPFVLCCK